MTQKSAEKDCINHVSNSFYWTKKLKKIPGKRKGHITDVVTDHLQYYFQSSLKRTIDEMREILSTCYHFISTT